ncbi:ribosome-binding factor A [bacterium]|nr:ribosome-binding factor A [bacterium]MBT6996389.1 ribosome-binding factor A [bacterium]
MYCEHRELANFENFTTIAPMKISPRSQKMASVIQQLLPALVEKILTPNQIGFLSITAVEIAGDLGMADIFVDAIGAPAGWIRHLEKISPKLEHEIARELKLRRKMIFRWKRDGGPLHAKKMESLMQE